MPKYCYLIQRRTCNLSIGNTSEQETLACYKFFSHALKHARAEVRRLCRSENTSLHPEEHIYEESFVAKVTLSPNTKTGSMEKITVEVKMMEIQKECAAEHEDEDDAGVVEDVDVDVDLGEDDAMDQRSWNKDNMDGVLHLWEFHRMVESTSLRDAKTPRPNQAVKGAMVDEEIASVEPYFQEFHGIVEAMDEDIVPVPKSKKRGFEEERGGEPVAKRQRAMLEPKTRR